MGEHKDSKENFQAIFDEGVTLFKAGNHSRSIEFLSRAHKLRPDDRHLLLFRAKTYTHMGHTELALQDVDAVLNLKKNWYKALHQKAETLFAAGDFEFALVHYHRAQKVRPDIADFRLGIQKAKDAIERSIAQDQLMYEPADAFPVTPTIAKLDVRKSRDLTAQLSALSTTGAASASECITAPGDTPTKPSTPGLPGAEPPRGSSTAALTPRASPGATINAVQPPGSAGGNSSVPALMLAPYTPMPLTPGGSASPGVSTPHGSPAASPPLASPLIAEGTPRTPIALVRKKPLSSGKLLGRLDQDRRYLEGLLNDPIFNKTLSSSSSAPRTSRGMTTPRRPAPPQGPNSARGKGSATRPKRLTRAQSSPGMSSTGTGSDAIPTPPSGPQPEGGKVRPRPRSLDSKKKGQAPPPPHTPSTTNPFAQQDAHIKELISGGLSYIQSRSQFWRQQRPPDDPYVSMPTPQNMTPASSTLNLPTTTTQQAERGPGTLSSPRMLRGSGSGVGGGAKPRGLGLKSGGQSSSSLSKMTPRALSDRLIGEKGDSESTAPRPTSTLDAMTSLTKQARERPPLHITLPTATPRTTTASQAHTQLPTTHTGTPKSPLSSRIVSGPVDEVLIEKKRKKKGARKGRSAAESKGEDPRVRYQNQLRYAVQTLNNINTAIDSANPALAIKFAKSLLSRFSGLEIADKPRVLVQLYGAMGRAFLDTHKFSMAAIQFRKQLDIAINHTFRDAYLDSLGFLGRTYFYMGDYAQAVAMFDKKLQYLLTSPPPSNEAPQDEEDVPLPQGEDPIGARRTASHLHHDIGRCYLEMGHLDMALEHGQASLDLALQLKDDTHQLASLFHISQTLYCMKQYPESIGYMEQYLEIARHLNDQPAQAAALSNLSSIHLQLGHIEASVQLQNQAKQLSSPGGGAGMGASLPSPRRMSGGGEGGSTDV
eukprot:gnl/Trimastix_PCT/2465.p1 GENE.gnl/Trimastix_PCT/2465~~gnl/Trimastix_PCT/2465.p1  ORF type:complete len:936 (+),score=168.46 gnl/Trimastix_PCT/2465:46-2853(+)